MNNYIFYWLIATTTTTLIAFSSAEEDNSTLHFFLLMVPESNIDSLRRRVPRQEEGVGGALGAIGEAVGPAANVGQILQGVLGGDLRPIFAGSTAFIPDGDFREGVTEILQQTVAPAIQRILMEFNKNVARHFNSTSTTPPPTQPPPPTNLQNNQNYNNFNNQYPPQINQPVNQFQQPNYNQFQQPPPALPPNQQFGGGAAIGAGNFNNQYNQLQNYQPNYANQIQQPPNYQNNQLNQFPPNPPQKTNFQQANYNQYQNQQVAPINPNLNSNYLQKPVQVQPAAPQPSFSGQVYQPPQQGSLPQAPPPQSTFTQQFQSPPQSFPQPPNSNRFHHSNYVLNSPSSSNDEK